jgi:quercetin dioxygenase-like cupin family protein
MLEGEETNTYQRPPEQISGVFLDFDLQAQVRLLCDEEAYRRGHNSKTLSKYPDFRVVLTAMKSGARIAEHSAAAVISVLTVKGHIRMHIGERLLDMPLGRLIVLDRAVPHDVEALDESAFLLTLARPEHVHR